MATLNLTQLATLKADIAADATLNAQPTTFDGAIAIAAVYNTTASPDFWVWQTTIKEDTITQQASVDGTTWSWPAYIARSLNEIEGWKRIMNGITYTCKPSLASVRQGFLDIFSGNSALAAAQRTHLNSICRRKATRFEQLFSTASAAPPTTSGAVGSITNIATMGVEGPLSPNDVYSARLLP
jgi:hypothetical protein